MRSSVLSSGGRRGKNIVGQITANGITSTVPANTVVDDKSPRELALQNKKFAETSHLQNGK